MKGKCPDPSCDSTTRIVDQSLGHIICEGCGMVIEEDSLVNEISFGENKAGGAVAHGFTIQHGQARHTSNASFGFGSNAMRARVDSREITRKKGHAAIEEASNTQGIKMDQVTVNMACNILDLALSHNYTKGRNYNCVIGGCCYIACRLNKTSHMLMDFSEAFAINVFSIGAVFVKLRDLFFNGKDADQMLPLVDPALYMARFAEKLEFGEMKEQVIMSALKLAQGMERSSLVTGRKPAGICAASLFVAARMYGFKRTIREIVLIVKVCGGTVRRRLRELADTELGDMTKDTFEGMATNPADPPSYNKRSRRRASIAPPVQLDAEDTPLLNEVVELIKASHEYDEENIDNLDDLDDDPDVIDAIQVTEEEKDFKNELWTMINSDWMEAQTHKDPSEYRPPKKKTKRGNQYDSPFKSENPADAVRKLVESKPQLSKRFNHDLVKDWFPEIEDE